MHLQLGNTSAGDPADPAWVATGRVGSCLAFTSADGDHASNAEPISFQTNELSVELWFRTTRERGSLFEAGREVYGLLWGGAVFSFVVSDGTLLHSAQISSLADLAAMTDGNWHYLAATYDGQAMRIYLDGEEKASLVTSATPPVVTAIHVGGHPSGAGGTDAEIDEVRLSSRARSAAEIQAHWGASSP